MTIDNNLSLNLNQCRYPLITYFSQNYARGFKIQMINRQNEFRYVLKFIYSEKATKLCKISTLLLSVCTVDKSKVEIYQNFVTFSEYMNYNLKWAQLRRCPCPTCRDKKVKVQLNRAEKKTYRHRKMHSYLG